MIRVVLLLVIILGFGLLCYNAGWFGRKNSEKRGKEKRHVK
jgi:hypothetical protein